MRKMTMRILLLPIILLNLICLNGCWDNREIDELGLVTAVGIDKGDDNRFFITVQIANPSSSATGSGDSGSNEKKDEWIATAEGSSIFDAVRKLAQISSRRVMWAHNGVVIIGESLAKEGIIPIVDFFTHDPELRMKAEVVVSKGNAKEYITAKIGMETPSGVSFMSLQANHGLTGVSVDSNMLRVSSALRNKYANPLISAISLKKATMQSSGDGSKQESSETVSLEGSAIFERDKMLGWLSPEETRGVSWILKEIKDTVVTVSDPDYQNKSVSVETKGVRVKIRSKVTNDLPRISIDVSGVGDIVEEDGSTKQNINEIKKQLTGLINKEIEQEIKNSLEVVQKKYEVDVLGFAAITHAYNNVEWHSGIEDKWKEIFPQIPVTVSVDISIDDSTLNQEPFKINQPGD